MVKRVLLVFSFFSLNFLAFSMYGMEMALPTHNPNKTTIFRMGKNQKFPDQIIKAVEEAKEVTAAQAFTGYHFYKFIGECNKGIREGRIEKVNLILNKRILQNASSKKIVDKLIEEGSDKVKVYSSSNNHNKSIETDKIGIQGSPNLSNAANIKNWEGCIFTTDSPLKKGIKETIKCSFDSANPYDGKAIPETPEKIKDLREEQYNNRCIPFNWFPEKPVAYSSQKLDVLEFKKNVLEMLSGSKHKRRSFYMSTMNIGPELAGELITAAKNGVKIKLVLDGNVSKETKSLLQELAEYNNVDIRIKKEDGINHPKVTFVEDGNKKFIFNSTQNDANESGKDPNTSVHSQIPTIRPVQQCFHGFKKDHSNWVRLSPDAKRYDAYFIKKEKKKKEEKKVETNASPVKEAISNKRKRDDIDELNKEMKSFKKQKLSDTLTTKSSVQKRLCFK